MKEYDLTLRVTAAQILNLEQADGLEPRIDRGRHPRGDVFDPRSRKYFRDLKGDVSPATWIGIRATDAIFGNQKMIVLPKKVQSVLSGVRPGNDAYRSSARPVNT